jgi:hypothetical protein
LVCRGLNFGHSRQGNYSSFSLGIVDKLLFILCIGKYRAKEAECMV